MDRANPSRLDERTAALAIAPRHAPRHLQRQSSAGRASAGWLIAIAVLAVAMVVGVLLIGQKKQPPSAPAGTAADHATNRAAASSTELRPAAPTPGTATSASATTPTSAMASAEQSPPRGIDPAQWQQVLHALATDPKRDAEITRLRAMFEFMADARMLTPTDGVPPSAEVRAAARRVEAGLGDRLAAREVSAAEALLLKQAAVAIRVSDPAARTAEVDDWRRRQLDSQPAPVADPRDAAYAQAERDALAAWNSQPAAARDPAQLQSQLQALRERIYGVRP